MDYNNNNDNSGAMCGFTPISICVIIFLVIGLLLSIGLIAFLLISGTIPLHVIVSLEGGGLLNPGP